MELLLILAAMCAGLLVLGVIAAVALLIGAARAWLAEQHRVRESERRAVDLARQSGMPDCGPIRWEDWPVAEPARRIA